MSMLSGTHCTLQSCLSLSFLPISCPYCRAKFCESHYLPVQHSCSAPGASDNTLSDSELAKRIARANPQTLGGPSGTGARLPCQKSGCKNFSLAVGGTEVPREQEPRVDVFSDGKHSPAPGQATQGLAHSAPRCERCKGLFCMSHRSVTSHKCAAPAPPTEGQQRIVDAEERKRRAREIISRNFPGRSGGSGAKK